MFSRQSFIYLETMCNIKKEVKNMSKYDMIPTGKKSKYGQPLYECAECKVQSDGKMHGHTVTYYLLNAQLCWEHFQEFRA